MTSVANASLACATALVDALAVGGVRHACLSPGSRSTPLALALARDDRIAVHVHLDERSAGFFAVGLAKASGEPVAVACTSGTATAEYLPAVVEASQSRTPLLVLTADRPPRVRGTGANQTIDQRELYGRYARAFLETPLPTGPLQPPQWAEAGARALVSAQAPLAGPVHVNCPFDEPLVPEAGGTATVTAGAHSDETAAEDGGDLAEAVGAFAAEYAGVHGVLTIGALPPPSTLGLLSLGGVLGWPVLAEPLSGLRLDAGQAGRSLAAGQFLLGDDAWLDAHRPDVVVQAGAAPTTRAAQRLAAAADRLVVLDRDHLDPDPAGHAERRLRVDPERFATAAWDGRETIAATEARWGDAWREADLVTHAAIDRALDGWAEPFEGRVARDVAAFLPHGATLVIGNSTPVRDLDAFMAPRRPPRIWTAPDLLRVIGNRGASGIDGLVSTALGVAAAGNRPTVALLGDLSFLYDAGALLWSRRLGVDVVLVVVSNGGGQIFAMLDQASLPELEELFVTPHPASIADVCRAAGVAHRPIEWATDLQPTLERSLREGGVHVVDVRTDPSRDRDRRAELRAIVRNALARR